MEQGINPDKSIAVIEQATTPHQKVFSTRIHLYEQELGNRKYVSPTLIIVGHVAGLYEEFKWMPDADTAGDLYFKPIAKTKEQEVRA